MDESLDAWNIFEKRLRKKQSVFCKKREIWWCSVGITIGNEIYGKNNFFERPVLVLKVFSRDLVIAIPLTSQKPLNPNYVIRLQLKNGTSYALLSQVRSFNTKRFSRKKETLDEKSFGKVLLACRKIFQ
jgi:mRNA interferase MazF